MCNSILIIEDDQSVNTLLYSNLMKLGYEVDSAFDGEEGLNMALEKHYQIILLDVMIPKLDGFQVLESLREVKQTPVLMLTAKGGEQDRICGFKTGADDYLLKPFNMAELELRIQAIIRRTQFLEDQLDENLDAELENSKASSRHINLNKRDGQVVIKQSEVAFTPIEFDLLYALVEEQGEVLSKAHLYQNVLLREFSRYDRTLDMHISKIRKKMSSAGMDVKHHQNSTWKGILF